MAKKLRDIFMPHPPLDSEGLLNLIGLNNTRAVRRYFEDSIAGRPVTRPEWRHLLRALEFGNMDLMKLLVTWGARPDAADLAALRTARADRYDEDLRLLRRAGLNLRDMPAAESFADAAPRKAPVDMVAKIPAEWRRVLHCLQEAGAREASIVGGALRDLYLDRPVKDVDIFILGSAFFQQRLIKKAFAAAGLEVHVQTACDHDSYEMFQTKFNKLGRKHMTSDSYKEAGFGHVESWRVVAGPDRTEYNIICMSGDIARELHRDAASPASARYLSTQFDFLRESDIGLCQILFDGRRIVTTEAYMRDVRDRTITLTRPDQTTHEHLRRVVAKYPDYAPCERARALLGMKDPPPPGPRNTAAAYAFVGRWYY